MAERRLVIDPQTHEILNVILVEDGTAFALDGVLLEADDGSGAGPGDRWDPAARRAVRAEREPEPAPPPALLEARARLEEAERAWLEGDERRMKEALAAAREAAEAAIAAEPLPSAGKEEPS